MSAKGLMTTREAGRELGVGAARIRQLILAGRIKATRLGTDWFMRLEDLEPVRVRRPGRPWHKERSHAKGK